MVKPYHSITSDSTTARLLNIEETSFKVKTIILNKVVEELHWLGKKTNLGTLQASDFKVRLYIKTSI